eukprot:ANDGO_01657.mRNA.1 hypothetical protein
MENGIQSSKNSDVDDHGHGEENYNGGGAADDEDNDERTSRSRGGSAEEVPAETGAQDQVAVEDDPEEKLERMILDYAQTYEMPVAEVRTLHAKFSQFDYDNSGEISPDEIKMLCKKFGLTATDHEIRLFVAEADEDRSGTVDFREFVSIISRIRSGDLPSFTKLYKSISSVMDSLKLFVHGRGLEGQLGLPDTDCSRESVEFRQLESMGCHSVASGQRFCVAVSAKNDLFVWGKWGIERTSTRRPLHLVEKFLLPAGQQFAQVACGDAHFLVLMTSGRIFGAGTGSMGQLGSGMDVSRRNLGPVSAPANVVFRKIACSGKRSFGISDKGELFGWGSNPEGWLGVPLPLPVSEASPALQHEMAFEKTPKKIEFPPTAKRIHLIAAGPFHALAVDEAGQVFSWGCGRNGRLGHGDLHPRICPSRIEFFAKLLATKEHEHRVREVSCGASHNLVLLNNGDVYSFGCGLSGRLGHGREADENIPRLVAKLMGQVDSKPRRVACGGFHSVIATDSGKIWAWGANDSMQLGIHPPDVAKGSLPGDSSEPRTAFYSSPQFISHIDGASKVDCGETHTVFIVNTLRSLAN